MTRFVAIASLRRGAIEPFELLEEADQAAALARLEHDTIWEESGEKVVWRGQEARVAPSGYKPVQSERLPKISQELRRGLTGAQMRNENTVFGYRERRERMRAAECGCLLP